MSLFFDTCWVVIFLLNKFKLSHLELGRLGLLVALVSDLVNSSFTNISNKFGSLSDDDNAKLIYVTHT